ncbi:MAG: glycosyltransferase [Phormidesmis sp.]
MKILVVSHSCVTAVYQQFYVEIQNQTGWEIVIVVPSNWKGEYDDKAANPQRWPSYQGELLSIPVWLPGHIPLHVYRSTFVSLLKQVNPDAIYVHHEPYGAATAQIYLANYLSIKKPIGFFTWQNIFKRYPAPFHQTQSFVFQQSSFAFAGSRSAEEVLREKGYKGSCPLLPGSVDPDIYFPCSQAKTLKATLRQSEDEVLIGYVGRIVESKGFKTLAAALGQIQDLPWRMVVVGSGDYQAEFLKMIDQLGLRSRVDCLGYVPHDEIAPYLTAFDLLVLPSETRPNWKEQFGRVIIESMACLTPVIGSNSGEIPNLITETGGGLIFGEGDPDALSHQIRQLVLDTSLREQMAERGRETVLEKYNSAAIAQRFIAEISRVTDKNHALIPA